MGLTTAVRLGAGLMTFTVMVRALGPQGFGIFALWLSVSLLATIATNYGLVTHVLREVGMSPENAETILDEGFTAKLLLAGFVVLSCVLLTVFIDSAEQRLVFVLLLFAAIADCFSEFMGAGLRARNRFDVETRVVGTGAVFHSALVITAAYLSRSVPITAAAYAASRVALAGVTFIALARYVSRPRPRPIAAAMRRLREAAAYAADHGLQSLFGQLDSVVLNYFVGPAAVGNYQAGMRIYQVGAQAVGVFSNVFLPRFAARQHSAAATSEENNIVQLTFIAAGALFGLVLALFSDFLVRTLLGVAYAALTPLLPLLGLLFFLRFSASAWGMLLTAAGHQPYRTACNALYWVIILVLAFWLVPREGSRGWLLSLCAATALLIVGYALRGRRLVARSWPGLVVPLGVGLPLLLWAARG